MLSTNNKISYLESCKICGNKKLKKVLSKYGLKHVDFSFEFNGSQIINQDAYL